MGQLMKQNEQWVPMLLELIPGWFQVFGIGHMVQGRVGLGLFIMLSYWALMTVNGFLTFFFGLGFVTGFFTWLFYMVASAHNAKTYEGE